jgi:hypothetical protein
MIATMATAAMVATACAASDDQPGIVRVARSVTVGNAWAGAPVEFALLTGRERQWVAYYDAGRRLTVASRPLPDGAWTSRTLDETVGWDSHNGVALGLDATGTLHLAANMHRSPLRYYRSDADGDARSLVRQAAMTGVDESEVTYPRFLSDADGGLLFTYRSGRVGSGRDVVNAYDGRTRTWRRLFDAALLDGGGTRSAYWFGPLRDATGTDHLAWVWRDSNDAATNHDVSYAQGVLARGTFRRADGLPLPLPLASGNEDVVDPVPTHAGLFNRVRLSLDGAGRVLLTYVKYDEHGRSQLYTARRRDASWEIRRTTDWNGRWEFDGAGSLAEAISFTGPVVWKPGVLGQIFTNRMVAPWVQFRLLDEPDLRQHADAVRFYPPALERLRGAASGRELRIVGLDLERLRRDGRQWILRWESAPANRDRPRTATDDTSAVLEAIELVLPANASP